MYIHVGWRRVDHALSDLVMRDGINRISRLALVCASYPGADVRVDVAVVVVQDVVVAISLSCTPQFNQALSLPPFHSLYDAKRRDRDERTKERV